MKNISAVLAAYKWFVMAICVAILIAVYAYVNNDSETKSNRPVLGLMTTLPLLWEEGDIGDVIASSGTRAPIITRLESDYDVHPLDGINSAKLKDIDILMLAQSRALSPTEFAALDKWVRGGGRMLLLADPALHWESIYPLGDKRRPLFTSLLSPLFKHWGVEMVLPMDEGDERYQILELDGRKIRTVTAGEWQLLDNGAQTCDISAAAVITICNVGDGKAVMLADADILDAELWRGSGIRAVLGSDDFGNVAWVQSQLDRLNSR